MKTGDIVKIENSDHIKIIKNLIQENQTAQVAFGHASQMIKSSTENLWKTIGDLFPELSEFEKSLDHTTLEIQLRYKKQ